MKTFLAIALLSLTLNLVSGYEYSEVEDRGMNMRKDSDEDSDSSSDSDEDSNEQMMDISETKKCYVYGQCQEYSIDFKDTEDPEGCHKFCGKNEECNWWSWEPDFNLCILYTNCTETGVDPPNVEACGECISGEKLCPARECHGAFKCKGDFVDSFAIATLEACIEKCNHVEDCQWFTLEKKNDHCILYEECHNQFDCETCATGEKKCANGYKGTTPAPATTTRATTTHATTPAPTTTPTAGGYDLTSKVDCGFPMTMLKYQYIDIRRCGHCNHWPWTPSVYLSCDHNDSVNACIGDIIDNHTYAKFDDVCSGLGHEIDDSCLEAVLKEAAVCEAPGMDEG